MRVLRDTDIDRDALIGAAIVSVLAPTAVVVAAEYLSVEAAQKAVFPEGTRFDEVVLRPSAEQRQAVLAIAGTQPRRGSLRVWEVHDGEQLVGHFFVDEVIGRQDLITYAVGIDSDGTLRTPEIMAYRESHGGEIRNASWRKQFTKAHDVGELRFRTDIKNIAGATLSCEHVTQGIRFLVALRKELLEKMPDTGTGSLQVTPG
jgi:hypothetical protein